MTRKPYITRAVIYTRQELKLSIFKKRAFPTNARVSSYVMSPQLNIKQFRDYLQRAAASDPKDI